jgi:hypothetical protein
MAATRCQHARTDTRGGAIQELLARVANRHEHNACRHPHRPGPTGALAPRASRAKRDRGRMRGEARPPMKAGAAPERALVARRCAVAGGRLESERALEASARGGKGRRSSRVAAVVLEAARRTRSETAPAWVAVRVQPWEWFE